MLAWRVFYDDGTTFDDAQGAPGNAPPLGVLVIVVNDPDVGRGLLHGKDYYLCVGDAWFGVDRVGLLDWVLHRRPELRAVLAGRSVSNEQFQAVLVAATNDLDFPRKSARRTNE